MYKIDALQLSSTPPSAGHQSHLPSARHRLGQSPGLQGSKGAPWAGTQVQQGRWRCQRRSQQLWAVQQPALQRCAVHTACCVLHSELAVTSDVQAA